MSYETRGEDTGKQIYLMSGMSDGQNISDADLYQQIIGAVSFENSIYNGTDLQGKSPKNLNILYDRITHLLSLDGTDNRSYAEGDSAIALSLNLQSSSMDGLVEYLVDNGFSLTSGRFSEDNIIMKHGDYELTNTDTSREFFLVIDGNVKITAGAKWKGILIASGNISMEDSSKDNPTQLQGLMISTGELHGTQDSGTISAGNYVSLKGRLVTTGSIHVGYGCDLQADELTENYLADIFAEEGSYFNQIFKNAKLTVDYNNNSSSPSTVDLSDMVAYENWHRIE